MRPGCLSDPGPPWVEAVTVGYVAAGVPFLGAPSLAAHSAEAIDGRTLRHLLKLNLKLKEEEEKREEELEQLNKRVGDDLPLAPADRAAWKQWACRPSAPGKEEEDEEEEKASVFLVLCLGVLPEEYKKIGFLRETTSGPVSVFFISWLHSRTSGYIKHASVYAGGAISHIFLFDDQGQSGSRRSFSTPGSRRYFFVSKRQQLLSRHHGDRLQSSLLLLTGVLPATWYEA